MIGSTMYIIFLVVFLYCALTVLYLFLHALFAKYFYRDRFSRPEMPASQRIAILVPGYKEDNIILSTAKSLLTLDYPKELYDVYIIADSFQEQTIRQLRALPIRVYEVSFDKSTKTKSLNEAFARMDKPYDIALICDADNILAPDFLTRVNSAFVNGAHAVQGRRVAKNLDTSFAILDACSEGINNNIFRKGANALGLSSSVIGSGMAFEFSKVKKVLSSISAVGGFDKILQLEMVEDGQKIQYLAEAIVFDEKVDSSHAFKHQRRRWVSSQFIYLKQFFRPAVHQLLKGNFSYFDLALVKSVMLPRAFLMVLLPLLVPASYFFGAGWMLTTIVVVFMYALSLLLALPAELINKDLLSAILRLPKAVALMFGALFHVKRANKSFIHTVHTKTEINNPLFNEHSK
ncbi:MAG TPA: glycosyltransferase [Flavisolibacter sp.]|nr:glycosyltransferase [Flavisolibacter sp.]